MTDKIIRLIVRSATSSATVQSLLNMQLLNEEYKTAYICVDKVSATQIGIVNRGLYMKISCVNECYINDLTGTYISQYIDLFDGVNNSTNTNVIYSNANNNNTWMPIQIDTLNSISFGFDGITNVINNADLSFTISVKIKFVK